MSKVAKISRGDIPGVESVKGMSTHFNVCQQTVSSEMLRAGVCFHQPNMDDFNWTGKVEESFFVAEGSIKLAWRSDAGEGGEEIVRKGEQIFLPKGIHYTLKATGEPAVNVFALAGPSADVTGAVGAEHAAKIKTAAEKKKLASEGTERSAAGRTCAPGTVE